MYTLSHDVDQNEQHTEVHVCNSGVQQDTCNIDAHFPSRKAGPHTFPFQDGIANRKKQRWTRMRHHDTLPFQEGAFPGRHVHNHVKPLTLHACRCAVQTARTVIVHVC